jgi:RNA polymerase sigma-70 factor (ECF subfamily)
LPARLRLLLIEESTMNARAIVEDVLAEHRPEMVAFVQKRAGHIVDPEDVLQQAAVRALAKSDQLREPAHARAWVYRIVRNVLADELRAVGLPVASIDDRELVEEPLERVPQTCKCALNLAKTLKPEYATILERAVIEEQPVKTIAAELGVTPNNAMVRLHRARNALRSLLEKHCNTKSISACLDCGCEERGCCAST